MTVSTAHGDATVVVPAPPGVQPAWSAARRIAFRFVFSYIVLFIFPFPFGAFPGAVAPFEAYQRMWRVIVPWVGEHVLGYNRQAMTIFPAGSGDTLFNYVQIGCFVVLALAATMIWTLLDRRRQHYRALQDGLRIYVRYMLGFTMLYYGMNKVIKLQFPDPSLQRLAQPMGSYSPFSLLWTFMGHSALYTHFAGAGEVAGAVLVFFRRTTTLGALIICAVMTHVLVLNLSYDVPVKIFAFHLVLLAMYLIAPDLGRLVNMLVLNRPVPAATLAWPFGNGRNVRIGRMIVKTIVLLVCAYMSTVPLVKVSRLVASQPRSPLFGIYQVAAFTRNGAPAEGSRTELWRQVVFDSRQFVTVLTFDDTAKNYRTAYQDGSQNLTLSDPREKGKHVATLTYSRSNNDHLVLEGTLMGQPVVIQLERDASKLMLVNRGFRWVSDSPYSR